MPKTITSRSTTKFFIIPSFLALLALLVGCGQADHPPRPGEYGQALVNSIQITQGQVAEINSAPRPKLDPQGIRPKVGVGFDANAANNPYRFVMVARGKAISKGEVDLHWIGGIMREGAYSPTYYADEDSHSYDANEPVLLVIASDPFSINVKATDISLYAMAELTDHSNFKLESLELQIWQGKGGKYSMTSYLGFLALLIFIFAVIYRGYSRMTGR